MHLACHRGDRGRLDQFEVFLAAMLAVGVAVMPEINGCVLTKRNTAACLRDSA